MTLGECQYWQTRKSKASPLLKLSAFQKAGSKVSEIFSQIAPTIFIFGFCPRDYLSSPCGFGLRGDEGAARMLARGRAAPTLRHLAQPRPPVAWLARHRSPKGCAHFMRKIIESLCFEGITRECNGKLKKRRTCH